MKVVMIVTVIVFILGILTGHQSRAQVSLGKFIYNGHGLQGEVIILNDRQYRIKGFSYDGLGPAVWHTGMRKGTTGVYSQDAYAFRNENNNCNRLGKRYSGRDVIITLPKNMSITRDLEAIAVYCYRFCHNFGHVKVPRGLKVPPAPNGLRGGGTCNTGHAPCSKDGTRDNGVCKRSNGREETCPLSGGGGGNTQNRINNNNNRSRRPNTSIAKRNPGGRFVNAGPRRLGRFISHENGVVGEVSILNDKQFRVRGFGYNGAKGKNTYFLLMERGTAGVYSVKGWAVPDERGRCNGLRGYRNEDVIITLPDEVSLRNVGAIAVYDYENCVNFGHIRVPEDVADSIASGGGRRRAGNRKVCLPYFRPCSRKDTRNDGVCKSRKGFDLTC